MMKSKECFEFEFYGKCSDFRTITGHGSFDTVMDKARAFLVIPKWVFEPSLWWACQKGRVEKMVDGKWVKVLSNEESVDNCRIRIFKENPDD